MLPVRRPGPSGCCHTAQTPANSFYVVNAIAVERAGLALTRQLAALPEVRSVSADPDVAFPGPVATAPAPAGDRNTVEWGVEKINAPAVWALGYTGQGITVGGADTGYDWLHPAILSKYRGWNGDFLPLARPQLQLARCHPRIEHAQ